MNMERKFGIVGMVASLVLASAIGASAATVSVEANAPESWGQVETTATTTLSSGASWNIAPATVNDSVNGQYKSPFDPANADNGVNVPSGQQVSGWEDLDYFTVGSPIPNNVPSPAILDLGGEKTILSLLWGSVDLYNAIQLRLGGGVIHTVSGQDVFDNGGEPAASGAALVRISGAGPFDEVRFFSNFAVSDEKDVPAFEFSNVVASVPLPAGGWLLITALGGMAALRRRRKAA